MHTILRHPPPKIKTPAHTRGHCRICGIGMIGPTCGRCRERRRLLIGRLAELIGAKPAELIELLVEIALQAQWGNRDR